MKKFTIEIQLFPQEFVVNANTKSEAMMKAQEKFHSVNNGASIYQTMIMDEEEI